jgi:hypothetical protein
VTISPDQGSTRLSSVLTRSAIPVAREKSGPDPFSDTFSMGRDRRQTRAARSVGRAAMPACPLQSPIPKSDETWDKGTSWQLVLRSWHTIPRPPREVSCGQNLPAGKDLAEQKTLSAGGGDPFSHRGKKDPRQPGALFWARPLTGDGTRDWDGIDGMSGRRWPIACQRSRRTHPRRRARWDKWTRRDNQKVDPPGRVPHI